MDARIGATRHPRTRGRGALAGEGGFLLVMVMVVMLVLSTIVASTLVNSFLERSLAKNQNYASVALQAAEAGLAAGMTWIRENQGSLPSPYTANPTWSQTLTRTFPPVPVDFVNNTTKALGPDGAWDDLNGNNQLYPTDQNDVVGVGSTYSVTMRFKREWRDVNGDGDCVDPGEDSGYKDSDGSPATGCPGDIVLYNKCSASDGCFNFPDARYLNAAEAFPVIELDAIGYVGTSQANSSSFREVALDVARNKLNAVGVKGAVTAKGSVSIKGTVDVYGNNYDETGTSPDPSCVDLPGAFVEAGQAATTTGGATYHGTPATEVNDGSETIYTTPWEILGITEAEMPAPVTAAQAYAQLSNPDYVGEIIYVQGDITSIPNPARGILVVHNPAGTAQFSIAGNNKFTGLIIADVVKITGTSDIVGGVLSMSTTEVDVSAGTPTIKYSCKAIEGVTRQNYSTKIGWHRLR